MPARIHPTTAARETDLRIKRSNLNAAVSVDTYENKVDPLLP